MVPAAQSTHCLGQSSVFSFVPMLGYRQHYFGLALPRFGTTSFIDFDTDIYFDDMLGDTAILALSNALVARLYPTAAEISYSNSFGTNAILLWY